MFHETTLKKETELKNKKKKKKKEKRPQGKTNIQTTTKTLKVSTISRTDDHRITESFKLEKTLKDHLVQLLCNEQGHL